MRNINSIIIHCTDTADGQDFSIAEIEDWHRKRALDGEPWRFYTDVEGIRRYIGYHFLVSRNGLFEEARPVHQQGCHTKGMNKESIGVCWVGRKIMTPEQKKALLSGVAELCIFHGLIADDVYPHSSFSSVKTCPNFTYETTFPSFDHFRLELEEEIRKRK